MAQKRNKRRNTARKKNNDGILGPLIGLLFGSSTVALLLLVDRKSTRLNSSH